MLQIFFYGFQGVLYFGCGDNLDKILTYEDETSFQEKYFLLFFHVLHRVLEMGQELVLELISSEILTAQKRQATF